MNLNSKEYHDGIARSNGMGGTLQAHKIQGCATWSKNKQDIDFAAVQNPAPDHGVVNQ